MSDTTFVNGTVVQPAWLNDVNSATYSSLTAVTGTNTITANGPSTFTAYITGQKFSFVAQNTNTGAVTININGIGNNPITKYGGGNLVAGDLVTGVVAYIAYDGSLFQLINPQVIDVAHGGTGSTTTNSAFTALSAGVTLSFRNKLINATGQVNQRAYVSGAATGGANQYTLDRWRVVTAGQNLTFSTSGIVTTMTAPAGGLEQVIEGNNIEGGVYTLSWTGTATATVNGSAITSGGQTASLAAGSNVTIRFTGGTVSLPQFEKATVATPFEYRFYGLELELCSRYYHRKSSATQAAVGVGLAFSTTHVASTIHFPTEMRTTPTFGSSALRVTDGAGASIAGTAASVAFFAGSSMLLDVTVAAGLTVGQASIVYAGSGAGGYIEFSAEL